MSRLFVLIACMRLDSIRMDCGFPALPESSFLGIDQYKKRYHEFDTIRYSCDQENQLLVGDQDMRCLDGKWTGRLPVCANRLPSKLKTFVRSDVKTRKTLFTRFLNSNRSYGCIKQNFNLTSAEKFAFDVETEMSIDYISLTLDGIDLVDMLKNGSLVLKAEIKWPRKKCKLNKFEVIDDIAHRTLIGFKCLKSLNESTSRPVMSTMIQMTVKIETPIPATLCSLNVYAFSDSCGSPEKPLHSIHLVNKKSFIVFSCEDDFYLDPITSQKVSCGPSAKWRQPFPRCLSKTYCRLPATDGSDPYIHVEYLDLNYFNSMPYAETNTRAVYSCPSNETDLKLVGESKRICHKGFWTGSQPKCVPNAKPIYRSIAATNLTKVSQGVKSVPETNWFKLHLVIISMLLSLIIGATFIGFIVYFLMKYAAQRRPHRGVSSQTAIPSLVVSEPNHYYQRTESYVYESLRLNDPASLQELQRINSLYFHTQ